MHSGDRQDYAPNAFRTSGSPRADLIQRPGTSGSSIWKKLRALPIQNASGGVLRDDVLRDHSGARDGLRHHERADVYGNRDSCSVEVNRFQNSSNGAGSI